MTKRLTVRFDLWPAASQWYPFLMTIALAKDVEEFLQEQVQAGVAGDASELANDVLRCVRDQKRRPYEITPQLEAAHGTVTLLPKHERPEGGRFNVSSVATS